MVRLHTEHQLNSLPGIASKVCVVVVGGGHGSGLRANLVIAFGLALALAKPNNTI